MAYSALPAKVDTDTLDLSTYNKIKDNDAAGGVAIVTTAGDIVYATGVQALARLGLGTQDAILVAGAGAPEWQIVPAARVYNTSPQTVNGWTILDFDTNDGSNGTYNLHSMHENVTNPSRLTVPANGGGLYEIGGSVQLDFSGTSSGTAPVGMDVLLNGVTVIGRVFYGLGAASIDFVLDISTRYLLSATDYVELRAYTAGAVTCEVVANLSPIFWATWLRRQ